MVHYSADRHADYRQLDALLDSSGLPRYGRASWEKAFRESYLLRFAINRRGAVVGIIHANREGEKCHLFAFAVKKRYRRHGVGSQLLQIVIDEARDDGCTSIYLLPSTRAKRFYENRGFRPMASCSAYLSRSLQRCA